VKALVSPLLSFHNVPFCTEKFRLSASLINPAAS
jgi:hypothetical protein